MTVASLAAFLSARPVLAALVPGGAWLSADGGKTWRHVFDDPYCTAALVRQGELYVSLVDNPYHDHWTGGGVVHSVDNGATWTYLDGPGLANWNVNSIAVDPFDNRTLWLWSSGNSVFVLDESKGGSK